MGVSPDRYQPQWSGSPQDLSALTKAGSGLGQGLASGFNNLIAGIGNALRGIFDVDGLFAPIGRAAAEIRDGQLDLNNRVDLLSPLQDYGSVYMPGGRELRGAITIPFTEQIGPMQGCERFNEGIRLLGKGLWDIRAQVTWSWVLLLTDAVTWEVRVYRPDGSIFSRQTAYTTAANSVTGTIVSSVVVPEAGYYVQVQITNIAIGRGIIGGPAWTRLTVQHISHSVVGDWGDGRGASDFVPSKPRD